MSADLTQEGDNNQDEPLIDNPERGDDTPLNIDQLIVKAGGFGKLQWLVLCFALLSYNGINFFVYNLAFLELVPQLRCRESPDLPFVDICYTEDICLPDGLKDRQLWEVNFDHPESFHNWMTDLELFCKSGFLIGLFGSMYFVGFAINGLLLKQSDTYGRKKIIIIGCFMQIL